VADGTFTANRSATITADHVALGDRLRDDGALADLFAGLDPQRRSRPTSKRGRIGVTSGVVEIAIGPGRRTAVTSGGPCLPALARELDATVTVGVPSRWGNRERSRSEGRSAPVPAGGA
jgi:hypothetical protein